MGNDLFLIGILTSLFLIVSKVIDPEYAITNRPTFYIALTTIIIGMQLFLAGFLSELVSRNAAGRNAYLVEEKAGLS
ncbi:hypothetical protein [Niabella hibiscisoli]|uniref:hypothetical protein n=1 Tax=Niabella hibiscisoli TaxID=1825928 RepID=UPI001F0E9AF6|nr:hypothetical protein [Niabella hibiscisoli]MCH5720868.1 hypothetical protein [Niabella hibiscisoli]